MNPEERHKRALAIADELNNDELLTRDAAPWINGPTKALILEGLVEELENDKESAETDLSEANDRVEELETAIKEALDYLKDDDVDTAIDTLKNAS